jgi:predicted helicase
MAEDRAPRAAVSLTRRDYGLDAAYRSGFGVQELMPVNSVGIVTARDALTIDMDKQALWERVQDFAALDPEIAREKYRLGKDAQDWTIRSAQADLNAHLDASHVVPLVYRPFDTRWTFYTGTSRGFHCRPRSEVMRHYADHDNLGLLVPGSIRDPIFHHAFVTKTITEVIFLSGTTASNAKNFPLYLYPAEQDLDQSRQVNFDPKLYKRIQSLGAHPANGVPDELAVFDYVYGVLHSPEYRSTYADLLKIDFPRIPWPASPVEFWDVSAKGGVIRRLHLMEPQAIGETPYPFRGEGDAVVDKPRFENGKVWINQSQYFDGVPEVSWEFYIGGYQPAQKWLKDRESSLTFEDVKHYQRILKILCETERTMGTITMTLDAVEGTE